MIFEDLMMILLDFLVVVGVFSVPKLTEEFFTGGTLLMQMGSTAMSIYMTLSDLFFMSDALGEYRLEYLLICLKAK